MEDENNEHVSYLFEIRYVTQKVDQRLAVSGSIPVMGNWTVENCVIAREIPTKSGRWIAAVELPQNSSFEWKWVVIAKDRSIAYRWEERPNRSLTSGTLPTHVRSAWNFGEELAIPIQHKFKQIGTCVSGDEKQEEWSYLPSQELLEQLLKDGWDVETIDVIPDKHENHLNPGEELGPQTQDRSQCHQDLHGDDRSKQINTRHRTNRKQGDNMICWQASQTESFDNLLHELENAHPVSDINERQEIVETKSSKTLIQQIRGFICTIL